MTSQNATFGASFGSIFMSGVRGYVKNIPALSLAAAITLGSYLAFRFPAQSALDRDDLLVSIILDLVGLTLGSIVAYPWYSYALDAADGQAADIGRPFREWRRFAPQFVASFWFWAGVLLGLRYLLGIPSILVVVFYAFYGFVIADNNAETGLRALGTSVRLGEGKRIGLMAIAGLFLMFNLFGAIAVGFEVNALTIALAVAGLSVTTSITMVAGARIYRLLQTGLEPGIRQGRKR